MTFHSTRRDILGSIGALAFSSLSVAQTEKKPFRMAVSDNYAPFYRVEDGQVRGVVFDILSEVIGKQMGVPIVFEPYPWARAQVMVEKNGCDALCTIATPHRLAYTLSSDEAVLTNAFRLFVRKDHKLLPELRKVDSLESLLALRPTVVSYLGSGWSGSNLAGMAVTLASNFDSMMLMLLAGRADIVIDGEFNVQNWLATYKGDLGRLNLQDVVMLPKVYDATKFNLLVSKQSAYVSMLPEFNFRMKSFRKTAGYRSIFQSYGISFTET
jgi:polar amino acid transport system substrate-binding protein